MIPNPAMITLSDLLSRTLPNTCMTAVDHYHYYTRILIHYFCYTFRKFHAIWFPCSIDTALTKANNHGWYSLFSSFQYDKMTSADISYQSGLLKLVMIISSSTHIPYDTDTFPFISVTLFCFLSNQYVLASVFLPFQLILLFSFCSLPYTFRFPFILLILLFPLSTCI